MKPVLEHRKIMSFTDVEKRAFDEAAENAGLALTQWIRMRLRKCASEELGRSIVETVGSVGGNHFLDQIQ